MFGFIKEILITAIAFIGLNSYNAMNATPLKCVSPVLININSNEPLFYPYIVTVNKKLII